MREARYGTRRAKPGTTAPRLLLLVTVVLAFAWMHTLGHHSAGHETPAHSTVAAAQPPGAPAPAEEMPAHGTAAAMRDAANGAYAPTAATARAVHAPGHDPAWTPMCLAVLAAAAALAAAALLTGRVRRATGPHAASAVPGSAGRGPPRYRPLSLLLADLTVLRI